MGKHTLKRSLRSENSGFTVVEILVVILIIGLLSTLLVITYSGIQQREHNNARINDIKLISSGLETYYAQNGQYPTLADMNSQSWQIANLKGIDPSSLKDPLDKNQVPQFSSTPVAKEYSYQPTASNGVSSCDNKTVACAEYVLTATLEGGTTPFVEKSLNN